MPEPIGSQGSEDGGFCSVQSVVVIALVVVAVAAIYYAFFRDREIVSADPGRDGVNVTAPAGGNNQ